jgi:tripartite ATP-independent transporter DctM subunit
MEPTGLDLLMFAAMIAGILLGYPVVFTLTGLGVVFALIGFATGTFQLTLMSALATRIFGIMTNNVLIAIPLFVFMGVMLERSKIAEELLEEMGRLFRGARGGLAISVTLVGALLAASTGIVGATVVTMGLIALPTMLHHGYDKRLAAGTVCTAGTLGQIIPPSTMLVILGEAMSSAYQQAQYAEGKFNIETLSVGQVFAAAMLPGLTLVVLYILFQVALGWLRPAAAPPVRATRADREFADEGEGGKLLRALVPPIILIVAVLGSILGGVATPTEAASVGAVGALMLATLRIAPEKPGWPVYLAGASVVAMLALAANFDMRLGRSQVSAAETAAIWAAGLCAIGLAYGILVSLWRSWRSRVLHEVTRRTMTISAMIFAMMIGASLFSLVFRGLGGDVRIEALLDQMPGGETGAILFVMAMIFVLGFFLDFVEISIIVIPIVAPLILQMDVDPIWLSVLIAVNLQTSFLTPPFGFSLFYLRGAAPKEVRTLDIYRGVLPYVAIQIAGMAVIFLVPEVATWLPKQLF